MSPTPLDQSDKEIAITLFKEAIERFLNGPSKSEEFSLDFHSLAERIKRESSQNIEKISEEAAKIFTEKLSQKRSRGENMSESETKREMKKAIQKAARRVIR